MPTPEALRRTIASYVAAVNSREADTVAALFAADAVQADPASNPPNVGRDAIRKFFADSIDASDSWVFDALAVHTCASTVAIDFRIDLTTGGSAMSIEGIEVFTVGDDGLITSAHAYWDDADLTLD